MKKGILWIKLNKASKEKLEILAKPKFPNKYCDHVTLLYGVYPEGLEKFIGSSQDIVVLENCWDNQIQAAKVRIDMSLPSKNANPHINISALDKVDPIMSNNMLAGAHNIDRLGNNVILNGVVEFYDLK